MKRTLLAIAAAWAAALALCSAAAAADHPPLGVYHQLPGTAGCVAAPPARADRPTGCVEAAGIDDAWTQAVSPDGRHLYLGTNAWGKGRLLTFRVGAAGALSRLAAPEGCLSGHRADGCVEVGAGIEGLTGLAISPDGRFLHVLAVDGTGALGTVVTYARDAGTGALTRVPGADGNVAIFDRDPATGALTQKAGTTGCVTGGAATADCAAARGLLGAMFPGDPMPIAISPDGRSVYVASGGNGALVVFDRDAATGALTQKAGVAGCLVDGAATVDCGGALNLKGPFDVEISADGATLAIASYRGSATGTAAGLALLRRATDGTLTQPLDGWGCYTESTTAGCTQVRAMWAPADVAFAPDGSALYGAGFDSATIAAFTREAAPRCADGTATATAGQPVTLTLLCEEPNGQPLTYAVVTGPAHGTLSALDGTAGTAVYTPAAGFTGQDELVVRASDGAHDSGTARLTVTVTTPPPPHDGRGGEEPGGEDPGGEDPGGEPAPQRLRVLARGALRADARGRVRLRVRCEQAPGARCAGALTLRTAAKVRVGRGRPRVATLATGRYAIARGRTATVTLRLSRPSRALLATSRALRVVATAGTTTVRLTLRAPTRARR